MQSPEGLFFNGKEGIKMNTFLTSNSWYMRLARTITQGVIGVLIANVDLIVSAFEFDAGVKAMIVALVMAVLSPVMAAIGTDTEIEDGLIGGETHREKPDDDIDEEA